MTLTLTLQAASLIVFVDDELDACLLSCLGIAAVAIPKQLPVINAPTHAAEATPTLQHQFEQEHEPSEQQQSWSTLLQFSGWRQQQQITSLQQGYEDPRLRLEGLRKELEHLKHEQSLSVSSLSSREGFVVANITQSYVSGLSLKFPAASTAVLAMDSGPVGEAVGAQLASLLGEVACRQVVWPDEAAAAPTAGKLVDQSAGLVQGSAGGGTAAGAAPEGDGGLAAEQSASPQQAMQEYLGGLGQQLRNGGVVCWNFPLVHAMFGAAGVTSCVTNACIWPIPGLERFSEHAADLLNSYDTSDVGSSAVSTGWESLDAMYKVSLTFCQVPCHLITVAYGFTCMTASHLQPGLHAVPELPQNPGWSIRLLMLPVLLHALQA